MKKLFLEAIKKKKKVRVKIYNKEKSELNEFLCIPFDISPPRKQSSKKEVFHFYNIDDIDCENYFAVDPSNIYALEMTTESFDPLTK